MTSDISVESRVGQNQGLVRSLATKIHRKTGRTVELDDLVAYGHIGLMEAARDFDPERSVRFSTYAFYRIRGAIYDGLARMCWGNANQRRKSKFDRLANEVLAIDSGSEAIERDARSEATWLSGLCGKMSVVLFSTMLSCDETTAMEGNLEDPSVSAPDSQICSQELNCRLEEAIASLSDESAALIRDTYFNDLTLQEAGKKLGISKSWASRLHARALERMVKYLSQQGFEAAELDA
jgi:RNA polymerase sigma factor for flagellar operon FliA